MRDAPARPAPVLELRGIAKSFGAVEALRGASYECRPGEVHALVGENGAGKSTLIGIASGVVRLDSGVLLAGGEQIDEPDPAEMAARGISTAYQDGALVPDISIADNLTLACADDMPRLRGRKLHAWARERLRLFGREIDPRVSPAELSAADRQAVDLVRALLAEPRVLILDEPTAALAGPDVARLFELLRERVAAGLGVVYITHRLREVDEIADRVTVLRDGETRGTWKVGEVDEETLLSQMVGREISAAFPARARTAAGAPVLEVEGLEAEGVDDVSFTVNEGEIVGLAGVEGNGQAEVVRAVAGLNHARGRIVCAGATVHPGRVSSSRSAGITFLSADRQGESIAPSLTIRENLVTPAIDRIDGAGAAGWIRRGQEADLARQAVEDLKIKAPSVETPVEHLSGGNQQKVALGRALLGSPRLLVVEEPTQGVDAGARLDFYEQLSNAVSDGTAALVYSSDAVELAGLCDRVIVMSRGRALAEVSGEDLSEDSIMTPALTDAGAAKAEAESRVRWRPHSHWSLPALLVSAMALLMLLYTAGQASRILDAGSLTDLALLAIPIALVAYAQGTVMMAGGIDLSVGPVMGLTTVVVSFVATETAAGGDIALAMLIALLVGLAVGAVNALLILGLNINAVAVTLATFIGVLGVGLTLRPTPDGSISFDFVEMLTYQIGGWPLGFLAVIALAAVGEYLIRRTRRGLSLLAVGSRPVAASRLGIKVVRVQAASYLLAGLLSACAGLFLATATGVGDASSGEEFTLQSVTAVALGGSALAGGRGSYLGGLAGALLLAVLVSASGFLQWESSVTSILTGGLMIAAITLYSLLGRGLGRYGSVEGSWLGGLRRLAPWADDLSARRQRTGDQS